MLLCGPSRLSRRGTGRQRPRSLWPAAGRLPCGRPAPSGTFRLGPAGRPECSPPRAGAGSVAWRPGPWQAHCHPPRAIDQNQPESSTRFWGRRRRRLCPGCQRGWGCGERGPRHPQGRTPACRPPLTTWPFLGADARAAGKPRARDREPGSRCLLLGPRTPKFTGVGPRIRFPVISPPALPPRPAAGRCVGEGGAGGLKACDPARSLHRLLTGKEGRESRLGRRHRPCPELGTEPQGAQRTSR